MDNEKDSSGTNEVKLTSGISSHPAESHQHNGDISRQNMDSDTVEFGDKPIEATCPQCQNTQRTKLEYRSGVMTYMICAIMLFFG